MFGRTGRLRFEGLWRHRDFMSLWAGQTVSEFGSNLTGFALPWVVLAMGGGAQEMGIIGAANMAPFLLVALFAGAWLDRMRRRPVLIAADAGRFALLALVPLGWLMGWLTLPMLYAIVFVAGVMTVFFDVAYQSYLPTLVGREHLVDANSKLEVTRSTAGLAGPSLAGWLVAWFGPFLAMLVDAASYVASVATLAFIRHREPEPEARAPGGSIWRDIAEGLGTITGNRFLRAIAGATATSNLCGSGVSALYVLYANQTLGMGPEALGPVMSFFAVGALMGALAASGAARRFGVGNAIVGSALLGGLAAFALPLASGPGWLVVLVLAAGNALAGATVSVYNINQVSLRQTITPDRLLGRMNASMRFIVWGTLPLGSLLGGALGTWMGLHAAILTMVAGECLAFLWVYFSPVRGLREQPRAAETAS